MKKSQFVKLLKETVRSSLNKVNEGGLQNKTSMEINREKEEISMNLHDILKNYDMDETVDEDIYELIWKFFRIGLSPKEEEKVVNYLHKELYRNRINEISSDLFKRASDKALSLGQDNRNYRMENTFFNKFIGKPLMQGEIKSIDTLGDKNKFTIRVEQIFKSKDGVDMKTKGGAVYDADNDQYKVYLPINQQTGGTLMQALTRVDARILQLIAQKINPNTKYKNGIQDLPVVGY
jgi:hypothetical protein